MILPKPFVLGFFGGQDVEPQRRCALARPVKRAAAVGRRVTAGPSAARGDQFPRRAARTPEICDV
jgi:hypothetical protein